MTKVTKTKAQAPGLHIADVHDVTEPPGARECNARIAHLDGDQWSPTVITILPARSPT
jgi:hypothetical protein